MTQVQTSIMQTKKQATSNEQANIKGGQACNANQLAPSIPVTDVNGYGNIYKIYCAKLTLMTQYNILRLF